MRNELGVKNTCYTDLTDSDLDNDLRDHEWEYVIFGEILEHLIRGCLNYCSSS